MEILETIMNESIQNQRKVYMTLTLLHAIDISIEETEPLKSVISILTVYLNSLYKDMEQTINRLDLFLVENE